MSPAWKIIYYESASGQKPVFEFIENLLPQTKAKIINTFNLLSEFGIKVGLPHAKKVTDTPLWELRILGQNNIRFFYIAVLNQTFLLLHGFVKKQQKTPTKEIEVAINRLGEYQSRS